MVEVSERLRFKYSLCLRTTSSRSLLFSFRIFIQKSTEKRGKSTDRHFLHWASTSSSRSTSNLTISGLQSTKWVLLRSWFERIFSLNCSNNILYDQRVLLRMVNFSNCLMCSYNSTTASTECSQCHQGYSIAGINNCTPTCGDGIRVAA